jgi:hypothetical protein
VSALRMLVASVVWLSFYGAAVSGFLGEEVPGAVGSNRTSSRLFSSYRLIRLVTTLPEERYAIATGCGSRSVRGGES